MYKVKYLHVSAVIKINPWVNSRIRIFAVGEATSEV